jgi:hypothetical protein
LKNQGYNFEHNCGLGQQNLGLVFVTVMMLAFLVDQTPHLCCALRLFQSDWKKRGSKRAHWERMRALFQCVKLDSMETLYLAILHGYTRNEPIIGPQPP